MNTIDRRRFFQQAIAGAGVLALPWGRLNNEVLAQEGARFAANDRVKLGKTGIVTSRLALGSGTHGVEGSSNQTRLGLENFVGIIRHGFEQGITFWDSADQYGSHTYFREALKYVPREKVVILSKSFSREADRMAQDIERYRKELGVDTIDLLLLHCLTEDNWPEKMQATMEVVSRAREKGILRTYGVSCHSLGALQAAARTPWTEVILSRLNPYGVAMDAEPDKVVSMLQEAHRNGKSILAMKIAGAGRLTGQIDESLKFVLGQGFVDAFTMGFESTRDLDQVIQKVSAVRV